MLMRCRLSSTLTTKWSREYCITYSLFEFARYLYVRAITDPPFIAKIRLKSKTRYNYQNLDIGLVNVVIHQNLGNLGKALKFLLVSPRHMRRTHICRVCDYCP